MRTTPTSSKLLLHSDLRGCESCVGSGCCTILDPTGRPVIVDCVACINMMHEGRRKRHPWIQTYSGISFTFGRPWFTMVSALDVAVHLTRQCRYAGAVSRFYSVAQHSVLVRRILRAMGESPIVQLWGLLHDAHEAYLTDLPTPVKMVLVDVVKRHAIENKLDSMIAHAMCPMLREVDPREFERIKERVSAADQWACRIERDAMMVRTSHWGHIDDLSIPNAVSSSAGVREALHTRRGPDEIDIFIAEYINVLEEAYAG